ncbi:hypothetical protein RhiirC2_705198 [Rhizophagus irregularis]|uniref:Uncharacterized protein n=1 Tax=Rhizophagus irregularis TaxID=588596 RepID=A0A2N1NZC2_9GLOM|nr:hypothetical protein RhiirC2_705198 [Rhizophagus irregularis]
MIPQQIQKKKALSQIQKKKQIKVGLMSHVYVLGAKRISTFFGFRKLGKHIVLRHQKPDTNGANQQWTLTKEGYIGLKSHPKYVINVKGTSIKDGSHVVLSDSNSVSFARCNFAKWEIISLNKDKPLGYVIFGVTKELVKEVSPNVYEGTLNGIDK